MASPEPFKFTVEPIISPGDFPLGYVQVQTAAFSSAGWEVFFPTDAPDSLPPAEAAAFNVAAYADTLRNDPSVRYFVAKLPSGKIIGIAKWNFFAAGPEPTFKTPFPPGANVELLTRFSEKVQEERRKVLGGTRHVKMATLAIDPEYQRRGVGGALLECGLRKCDEEGLTCWIEASEYGKGLYLKHHWEVVSTFELDTTKLAGKGKEGPPIATALMIRHPQPLKAAS